jgi:cysteine desulfurase
LAASLHATPQELVVTGGGTESNNLALFGLVRNLPGPSKHVITTAIEHPSVLEPCRQLEREGVAVSYVEPGADGTVASESILSEMRPTTVLVSVMHANNETGTSQPVTEIAQALRPVRQSGQRIYLHSDGVQAFGKTPTDVRQLGIDLYSVSAHKIFAPKGIGALFVRKGTPLKGIQFGGRHERERRAGTENVPGVMAFAEAARLCTPAANEATAALRDRFERFILAAIDDVAVNGSPATRLPNTSNLLFRGVSGEALVIALDMKGIAVSSGSACSSGSVEPSHVLLAMGLTAAEARSSVRFSFGRYNTAEEVDILIEAVIPAVRQLRRSHTPKEQSLVTA